MNVQEILVSEIRVGDRLRSLDEAYVAFLSASMADHGLTSPIVVGENSKGSHLLLAGMHRLSAARELGWETIAAIVDPNDDHLHQSLIEIDENLVRRDLSDLDRAVCLMRRQEVYEIMHPNSKAGVAGALAKHDLQTTSLSFAEITAEKLGLSPRSIQRNVNRARRISPDVQEKISTTWIANNGSALDSLAKLEAGDQLEVVGIMLRVEAPCKNVASAVRELTGKTPKKKSPEERQLDALQSAWARAKPKVREQFLEHLRILEEI